MKENYTVSFTLNDIAQCRLVKAENAEQARAYFAEIEPTAEIAGAALDQCHLERRGCPVEIVPDGWTAAPAAEERPVIPTTAEAITEMEKAEIAHKAAASAYSEARDTLHDAIKNGTDAEKAAARDAAEKAAKESEYAAIIAAITTENARAAWAAEYLPKICEILNQYEGKKIGDKTRKKIYNEIFEATDSTRACVIFPEYGSDYIHINHSLFPHGLDIYRAYNPDDPKPGDFRDADGKLKHFDPAALSPCKFDYTPDPAAKYSELAEKLEAVKAAWAALEAAISDYNNTAGTAFESLYARDISSRCNITAARR